MEWKVIEWQRDKKRVHDICYGCGSAVSKQSYAYIDMLYRNPQRTIIGEFSDSSFYVVTPSKKHWRLIEIATTEQGGGIGKATLLRLLKRMQGVGVKTLTFRTPINETAIDFWLHMGAKITGLKDNDYEMQIILV